MVVTKMEDSMRWRQHSWFALTARFQGRPWGRVNNKFVVFNAATTWARGAIAFGVDLVVQPLMDVMQIYCKKWIV